MRYPDIKMLTQGLLFCALLTGILGGSEHQFSIKRNLTEEELFPFETDDFNSYIVRVSMYEDDPDHFWDDFASNFDWDEFESRLWEMANSNATRVKRYARYPMGRSAGKDSHKKYEESKYPSCKMPDGYPGKCKPASSCASYYASESHYNPYRSHYKSCQYGYGYEGVCCPESAYKKNKKRPVSYNPVRYGDYVGSYGQISDAAVREAIQYAARELETGPYSNDDHLGRGEDDLSYWGNGIAKEEYQDLVKPAADTGYFIMLVTRYLSKHYGYQPQSVYDEGLRLIKYAHYMPEKFRKVCEAYSYIQKCDNSPYRSIDGSCNNLKNPYWGQANTVVGRIRVPRYADGIYEWRRGYNGYPLPMVRKLRLTCHPNKNVADRYVNGLFMAFGQTIVHDSVHTPFFQANNGDFIDCCFGYRGGEQQVSPKCSTIEHPRNDPFYSKYYVYCNNMARSSLAPHAYCQAGYGAQLNFQTSYIDLSLCYGRDAKTAKSLRTFKHGLLRMSKVGDQYILPHDANAECFKSSADLCMKSGDFRTNIQPGLTMLQIIHVRFHNLCAKRISHYYQDWDDEKIYQECRRITIAVMQHITYSEYVTLLLGYDYVKQWDILPPTYGYSYDYDETVNPWTVAEFSAAAFRHHTSVYGRVVLMDDYYKPVASYPLEELYNSNMIFKDPKNFDMLVRGYLTVPQRKIDTYFDSAVSDKMLKDKRHFGLDLSSMNLFRGREYGLGSYNDYREVCGLPRAKSWYDFYDWIDPELVKKWQYIYKHPDDVELYSAVGERHMRDALLGPTWGCIVAYQFQNWKWGDRFFYTAGGQPHSFSMDELDEIRKMSMASLLCMTTGVKKVPMFAFRPISKTNPLVSCDSYDAIPRLNFKVFKSTYDAGKKY